MKWMVAVSLFLFSFHLFAQADEMPAKRNTIGLHLISGDRFHKGINPFFISEIRYENYFTPTNSWHVVASYRNYEGKSNAPFYDEDLEEFSFKLGLSHDLKPRYVLFYFGGDIIYSQGKHAYDTDGIVIVPRTSLDVMTGGVAAIGGVKKTFFDRLVVGYEINSVISITRELSDNVSIPRRNRERTTIDFGFNLISALYAGYLF